MAKKTFTTIDPTTERKLQTYSYMSDDEVAEITAKVDRAQKDWGGRSLERRADILRGVGQALESKKEELAELMTREMGKVVSHSRQEIDLCSAICRYTAEHGPEVLARERRAIQSGREGVVCYAPLGVVYGIQPWNFPAYQVVRYSIASLMAGNGILLKHAENVTGSGLLLEEIYREGGIPEDLFRVIVIDHDQSDRVIENELVRGVTFTGSPRGGAQVAAKAGEQLKKTVMELGSNDAYLVFEDADLERAVKHCVMGRVYNNGETCVSAKRFIVAEKVYDEFREGFVQGMKAVRMGNPFEEGVQLGPMAREDLLKNLDEQTRRSVDLGARLLCGGERAAGKGYFYPATVLENVQPGQPAYDDELFGPVAALIRARDDDDALRLANDSRFGLGGGIFSRDEERAVELAATRFDTGMVFVNGFGLAQPNMPFGGVKNSGWGREHGGFGMREFVNTKAINIMG